MPVKVDNLWRLSGLSVQCQSFALALLAESLHLFLRERPPFLILWGAKCLPFHLFIFIFILLFLLALLRALHFVAFATNCHWSAPCLPVPLPPCPPEASAGSRHLASDVCTPGQIKNHGRLRLSINSRRKCRHRCNLLLFLPLPARRIVNLLS